ncbi:phytanoyl-CoA dioxygenase family protein [Pannonibacter carbonis]|uniref:phytanoyl-CoA dioxygenase family protein n=1 Tax=Pannonibacter carbonis TaxID=2067569 RepID=UPI000D10DB40|nr:phytanoyl-CoA dioxygenase family protein [Pannonibacter carbonis]
MRMMSVLKAPVWALELATGAKSFIDNPILGSRVLNERGLHVNRVRLAQRMSAWRRRRLAHLVSPDEQAAYAREGFVVRGNVLPADGYAALRAEVDSTLFDAWEMRQGNAVTRFIPLPPEVLTHLPHLRAFVTGAPFQNTLKYVASTAGDPIVYLHVVLTVPDVGAPDPQTHFHSDTFQPTAKAWYFLQDVHEDEGPFTYVPGSHLLTPQRFEFEQQQSLLAASHPDRLHARGSFRISREELSLRGFAQPVSFAVPGNTLVVADTHGFHARGASLRPSVRIAVYGSLRRNPFLPFTGLDPLLLPGLAGRQGQLHVQIMDLKERLTGKPTSHRHVGKVRVAEPARI